MLSLLALLSACSGPQLPAPITAVDSPDLVNLRCPEQSRFFSPSRDVETCVLADGTLHGPWRSFQPSGELALEGHYERGEKAGAWRALASDGVTEWEEEYAAPGELAARWEFNTRGTLRSSLRFEGGHRHGRATWFRADGSPQEQVHFANGSRHGSELKWREDGTLAHAGSWAHGERDGEWIWTDRSGSISHEKWAQGELIWAQGPIAADLGELDCPEFTHAVRTELNTGSLEVCQTASGTRHGPTISRYADGSIRRMGAYSGGQPEGAWSAWCQGGTPSSQGQYRDGQAVGTWTTWGCDGTLIDSSHRGDLASM